jgi:hypothetical protein
VVKNNNYLIASKAVLVASFNVATDLMYCAFSDSDRGNSNVLTIPSLPITEGIPA